MLAPEERDVGETFAPPQDIARDGLALAFGNHPVFDPERFPTVRIRPSRDIAGGIDSRRAGLQVCVHDHTAVDREAGLLGKLDARPHADADDDEVGRQRLSSFQPDVLPFDGGDRLFEMEDDAVPRAARE